MKQKTLSFVALLLAVMLALSSCGGNPAEDPAGKIPVETDHAVGEKVVHTDLQSAYWNDNYENISAYATGDAELSRPVGIPVSWTAVTGATGYTLTVRERGTASAPLVFTTADTSFSLYNLKIATAYEYRVEATVEGEKHLCKEGSFTVGSALPRNIYCDGVTNMRDLGGYVTPFGTVKQGLLYRSGRFNTSSVDEVCVEVTEAGKKVLLEQLGIASEIDLRRPATVDNECGGLTDTSPIGEDLYYFHFGMEWEGGPEQPANYPAIREVFSILADEDCYPIVFHCNIGTDRTGYIAFLVDGLLGVPEETLYRDYLFSNFGNIGSTRGISGIRNSYVKDIQKCAGDTFAEKVEDYLIRTVGVSTQDIADIKKILLSPTER